ncbi:hypothetical protein BRYFOR_07439 [Marvinbryantia formatexigens DSM 14469]|uniref:Cytidylate kinase n=2 Tax=Marvinbryantia TaxID=248744 RepID=C6LFN6_9FIRM|nr:hypothetical protein BRYFOR_07439 [Marvinbryantia formatexigens DSM 14469]
METPDGSMICIINRQDKIRKEGLFMIICIGREFGSGGHEIGKCLSEGLGIPFYDHELVEKAMERSEMTLELAKDDCVFVGRCADFVLKQQGVRCVSLFITAPFEDRVKRKAELLDMKEKQAVSLVRKMDKQRKAYYDYYTGGSWGRPHNYDFCINSSSLGIKETADTIETLIKSRK